MAFLESSGAKHGWITPVLMAIFKLTSAPSRILYRLFGWLFSTKKDRSAGLVAGRTQFMVQDTFVVLWLILDLASLWAISRVTGPLRVVAVGYSVWRLVDIISSTARVTLARLPEAIGPSRLVVHGLVNYIEAIVCFALVYSINSGLISTTIGQTTWWLDESIEKPLHLSFITQLTIGYGDYFPTGWLRPIAWLQGLFALVLIALHVAYLLGVDTADSNQFEHPSQ